jgi:hypothetical protein
VICDWETGEGGCRDGASGGREILRAGRQAVVVSGWREGDGRDGGGGGFVSTG